MYGTLIAAEKKSELKLVFITKVIVFFYK